jgi:hypothetical protein
MKSIRASWLLPVMLTATGVAATYATCPGCVDHSRANSSCDWTRDSSFTLDPTDRGQWRHLVSDTQLAEEIAVQYGDAQFYRWAFPVRQSPSGPTQTQDTHADNIRAQVSCLARLDALITNVHGVSAAQVDAARAARIPEFDALVLTSFLPLFIVAVVAACAWLRNMLLADGPFVRAASRVVAATVVSALGVLAFRLWWTLMEGLRIGNPTGHMGMRTASVHYWTLPYALSLFGAGVLLFWVLAVVWAPRESANPSQSVPRFTSL